MMKIDPAGLRRKAKVELTREEADTSYKDAGFDEEALAWVKAQLAAGNDWAWCDVKVTARIFGLEAETWIGQCSYESRKAFMDGGYYEQLVDEVIAELAKMLENIADDHDIWEHDRVTCIPCASISG